MYLEISPRAAKRYPLAEFTDEYGRAQEMATVASVTTGEPTAAESEGRPAAVVPVSLQTHAFGQIDGRLVLPLAGEKIAWSPNLVFPGLGPGERLVRRAQVPERAPILARDGTPLAEGPAASRSSPLGAAAQSVAGEVASPTPEQDRELTRLGFPPGTPTGTSGLELAFNRRLAGRPGGELVAVAERGGNPPGGTVLAEGKPVPRQARSRDHRPRPPAGRGGGARRPASAASPCWTLATARCWRLAGIAFSGPQPPGSTFKVITTTAALEAGVVELTDQFPVQTSIVVGGREVANAHNEACGGSFVEAFAKSCNSVFAPLGPKLGSERLVEAGRALRLQLAPGPVPPGGPSGRGPAPEHDPRLDPRRPRAGGERDRPGPGAGHAAPDGLGRSDDRRRRRAEPHPDRQRSQAAASGGARAGDVRAGGDDGAQPDDPGGAGWDGHGRRAPGDSGGRQDRHRRARPEAARARPASALRTRRPSRRWTPGSPPSRRQTTRSSRRRRWSSTRTGTAAPWRRRSFARCSPRASARSAEPC